MSLGPLLPGRIPNSLLYSRSLQNLSSNTRQFQSLQDQISTGQRFQTLGENPAAAIQTMLLQLNLERSGQLASNVELNRSLLSTTEQTLNDMGNVFDQAKSLLLAGVGDNATAIEKQQMASDVDSLIRQVTLLGNMKFRGRYLFGGSVNTTPPFSIPENNNGIRFNGDFSQIGSFVGLDNLLANNISAGDTLKPLAEVHGTDLNPALTADTRINDLFGGAGITLGEIDVTVDTGLGPQTERIDLTSATRVGDLVTRIEAAFGGDLTVGISASGITLTPSAGTVSVADLPNSRVAARLGINSAPAASITSTDLNPRLSLQTSLSSLNGGTGIGATAGTGLLVTNGNQTATIDLNGLNTIEDLFNAFAVADIDVMTGFTDDGSGLRIASRLSGVDFSIGENGGDNATLLGIRTLTGSTPLSGLNMGKGVPAGATDELRITRRDGSAVSISLTGAATVQDVLDRLNAVDPGVLTATLNTNGNGISLADSSGTGALTIEETPAALALDLVGTVPGITNLEGSNIGISAATDLLAGLNGGTGVPVGPGTLDITRRDGSVVNISLAGATAVQDVLDAVNAIDPGNLVLGIDPSQGRFVLSDNSGTGPLSVADGPIAAGLGIDATAAGLEEIRGGDPNPQRAGGVLDLLFRLSAALRTDDLAELQALDAAFSAEVESFNFQRGALAGRLKNLDQYAGSLADQEILIKESLSLVFETDMVSAITEFTALQATIQATQQIAASSLQMNLFNYL